MKRYALALDLVDQPQLISEYVSYHQQVWPEIKASIKDAGVENMEIYRVGNRLFMVTFHLIQDGDTPSFLSNSWILVKETLLQQ